MAGRKCRGHFRYAGELVRCRQRRGAERDCRRHPCDLAGKCGAVLRRGECTERCNGSTSCCRRDGADHGRTAARSGRRDAEGRPQVYNSVLAFDGAAQLVAQYDKWRLVPGGEFLPFEWLLAPLGFRKVVTVPGSFAAGPGPVTLADPRRAATPACSSATRRSFPTGLSIRAARPGWLINVTNDGWFGRFERSLSASRAGAVARDRAGAAVGARRQYRNFRRDRSRMAGS